MLVHDKGDKDILGFICDMCTTFTSMDVIPNEHGEFRYICPKCGHHMKELPEDKKEEAKMVNSYTVDNAAKRLNCSRTTITRAIYDGRFQNCFTVTGHTGRPAWMIPSDQVEEWVTNGGFLLPRNGNSKFLSRKRVEEERRKAIEEVTGVPSSTVGNSDDIKLKAFEEFQKNVNGSLNGGKVVERDKNGHAIAGRYPWGKDARKVFDPEVGKEVPVLDLFGEKPLIDMHSDKDPEDEFAKRAIKRVAKQPKWTKVLDRTETIKEDTKMENLHGDTDGDNMIAPNDYVEKLSKECSKIMAKPYKAEPLPDATQHITTDSFVRTDGGFSITIPTGMIEGIVKQQVKEELGQKLAQLRKAVDILNDELKTLEEAIA